MEPLPVPDATESTTDTAWGLWENTLHALDDPYTPTQAADLLDFPDTVQADLPPPSKKP